MRIINSLTTQPIDASEDVTLTPPGAVKVADKTGADLFAIRFNSADLTGTLNGAVSSLGSGEYTYGVLFQNDAEELLDGNLIFSSGKMMISATGKENAAGVYGSEITLTGVDGIPLTGSLNASSKSGTSAQAVGIYADEEFRSTPGFSIKMTVKADAAKGVDANAAGFGGNTRITDFSDKFSLNVQSKAGSRNASAYGVAGTLTGSGALSGSVTVKSDASKGVHSIATGFYDSAAVAAVGDKFKLDVQAKAGTGYAEASGFDRDFSAVGTLGGTVTVKADAAKGTEAAAVGFLGDAQVADINDKFKLNAQARSGPGSAAAAAFAHSLRVAGTLGGTITVKTDSKSERAWAVGFNGNLQATGVSDEFKLAVNAKSGSGSASARGFSTVDIANGLSGEINVFAMSTSGVAQADGGYLSASTTFKTGTEMEFVVTAQTGSRAIETTAYGFTGDVADIELEGGLAVTAKGANSTAWGIQTMSRLTGSISGVVAAVGNTAFGVYGGDDSDLTISGAVYAGNKGSAVSIAKNLGKSMGTGKSAAGMSKNADQAVRLGAGSTLTLNNGSIVIGDVTLGTGSNLNLSTGSQLYGDIDMNASGNLSITVDGTLAKAATVNLASAGAGVFAEASGVDITLFAFESTRVGRYVLLSGSDLTELSNVDFNTRFDLMGFDVYDLQVDWELDLGKTDTLTMILSENIGGGSGESGEATLNLLSATDLNSADRLLASSSLTESAATSGASFWRNSLIA